jgi:hypothetical protein
MADDPFVGWEQSEKNSQEQVVSLKASFKEILDYARQDNGQDIGFFAGVLDPKVLDHPPNFFQDQFDCSINSRIMFDPFVDHHGVRHLHHNIAESRQLGSSKVSGGSVGNGSGSTGESALTAEEQEAEQQRGLVTSSIRFLKCWYESALAKLSPTVVASKEGTEVQRHLPLLAEQLAQNPGNKNITTKCIDLIGRLEKIEKEQQNYTAIHGFIVSLRQDVEICVSSLEIEEFVKNKVPAFTNLLDAASKEISRYKECDLDAVKRLKQAASCLEQTLHGIEAFRKQGPGFTKEWFEDAKAWKRFCFLKGILAKMSDFVLQWTACMQRNGSLQPTRVRQFFSADYQDFKNELFNLVCIFATVILEVNANWPNPRESDVWKQLKTQLLQHTSEKTGVQHCLTCAANEAAARWLQMEMSGFCYDACRYEQALPAETFTRLNRQENLAVDMHPDCDDIIGMRVWFIDQISTGGFNQLSDKSGSTCGVLVVHVFLRPEVAILRLKQPDKMQAKYFSGSIASGNIQLPSWIEDACVSRLFYQVSSIFCHAYQNYGNTCLPAID